MVITMIFEEIIEMALVGRGGCSTPLVTNTDDADGIGRRVEQSLSEGRGSSAWGQEELDAILLANKDQLGADAQALFVPVKRIAAAPGKTGLTQ